MCQFSSLEVLVAEVSLQLDEEMGREEQNERRSTANLNSVFYAESYHPIQAGSIDGTDILPHDNAIYRALLCSNAGLC